MRLIYALNFFNRVVLSIKLYKRKFRKTALLCKCKISLCGNFISIKVYWESRFKIFFFLSLSTQPDMMQPEKGFQGFGSKRKQNSFAYDVQRDVYNEETFQQDHRRKSVSSGNLDIDITTFRHHIQCRWVCGVIQLPPSCQHQNSIPLVMTSVFFLWTPVIRTLSLLCNFSSVTCLWFVL